MPTALTPTNINPKTPQSGTKPAVHSSTKKNRSVRRRGRAKKGFESDDEIEREARTDSETDDNSSLPSDSDSDTASDDDDHPANSFEVVTPSTTQSPPPLHVKDASGPSDVLSIKTPLLNGHSGPFVGATDWAQMVADENAAGAGDLPVIDFSDLNGHSITQRVPPPTAPRTQKQKRQAKKAAAKTAAQAPARVDDDEATEQATEPVASSSRPSSRERLPSPLSKGQTPRQAYQHRLESDPSYVPTVGEFWGHDDRLLDKDLRSLSGWWRGRWHSRGRGRGGFAMRGRGGRGGFIPGRVPGPPEQEETEVEAPPAADVPPIERAWTHDGFEEMKRRDERRKVQFEQQKQQQASRATSPPQRGVAFRGRGGFVGARGRGGFTRGGTPYAHSSPGSHTSSFPEQRTKRVWYAMPPERSWTKHHDFALYSESGLKPRAGQGPGFRVKLPGRTGQVVRTPSKFNTRTSGPAADQTPTARAPSTVALSEDGDRAFVVRIPGVVKKPAELPAPFIPAVAVAPSGRPSTVPDTTTELTIEEVFTVRPNGAPAHVPIVASDVPSAPVSDPSSESPAASTQHSPHVSSPATHVSHLPESHAQQQLEHILVSTPVDANVNPQIEETLLRKGGPPGIHAPVPQGPEEFRPLAPVLHPIQTSFSPIPQPSPPYGSPYTYGSLPPGVAMSHHGYPYEVATGRPVYLQPNPPPTMYTPRPMMHAHMGHHHSGSIPFIPGHVHHSSVASASPDFLTPHSHPHTPPMNGFVDPMTGVPIFTPARQSSRIEIRAPDGKPSSKVPPGPSGLRAAVSGPDAHHLNGDAPTYYARPQESNITQEAPNGSQEIVPGVDEYLQSQAAQGAADGSNVAYPQYQQYYYPEHYGYPPYVDPNMHSQVVQYDMYRPEPHPPHQPVIYY